MPFPPKLFHEHGGKWLSLGLSCPSLMDTVQTFLLEQSSAPALPEAAVLPVGWPLVLVSPFPKPS